MTLIEDAKRAYEGQQRQIEQQEDQFNQQVRRALKAKCFDVFAIQITLDQIDDNLFVEIDGLFFSLVPTDPIMAAPLAVMQTCSDCEVNLMVPFKGMPELGAILQASETHQLYCEACALLHQESFDPPEGTPQAKTSLETFVEALQAVLVDYSLGGASMLDDLRKLIGERNAHPAA